MLKIKEKRSVNKFFIVALVFLLIIFSFSIYGYFRVQEITDYSKYIPSDAKRVVYQEKLSFDPEALTDITDTEVGTKILDSLNNNKLQASIPAKSKITIPMASYCLDSGRNAPEVNWPSVFSYEKADIPMYSDIITYIRKNTDVSQDLVQQAIWDLSPDSQLSFDDLSSEEQTFLLTINPNAKKIIDSYKYFQDYDIKYFQFPQIVPDKTIAQIIPGTKLYAKSTEVYDYSVTVVELYNPTDKPQTFSTQDAEGNILTTVPMNWGQAVKVNSDSTGSQETSRRLIPQVQAQVVHQRPYDIISGRDYEVADDDSIKTGPHGYVVVRIGDSYTKIFENTIFEVSKKDPYLTWLERIYLKIWRYSKRNGIFQRKYLGYSSVRG